MCVYIAARLLGVTYMGRHVLDGVPRPQHEVVQTVHSHGDC